MTTNTTLKVIPPTVIPVSQVEHPHYIDTLERLCQHGAPILTPTSLFNPLLVRFHHGKKFSAYALNYMAAVLTREKVGNEVLIGGTVDLSFFEPEWLEGNIPIGRITASVREQVNALRYGGVDYIFFQGFKGIKLLEELIKPDIIGTLPIAFTVSADTSDDIPDLINRIPVGTKIFAAGITLNFEEIESFLGELVVLAFKLREKYIHMIVMFKPGYCFSGNGFAFNLEQDRIHHAFELATKCGAGIVDIISEMDLPSAVDIIRHKLS